MIVFNDDTTYMLANYEQELERFRTLTYSKCTAGCCTTPNNDIGSVINVRIDDKDTIRPSLKRTLTTYRVLDTPVDVTITEFDASETNNGGICIGQTDQLYINVDRLLTDITLIGRIKMLLGRNIAWIFTNHTTKMVFESICAKCITEQVITNTSPVPVLHLYHHPKFGYWIGDISDEVLYGVGLTRGDNPLQSHTSTSTTTNTTILSCEV